MITIRKAEARGSFDHGWLRTHHSFSFSDYYDPQFMGFRSLRVINDDYIGAAEGFPTHGHRDMEIITYIIEGALEHRDTIGNHAVIRPGEVQYMSAGTGIRHSEFNHLKEGETHLHQIWILPDRQGHAPRYGQKSFLPQLEQKNFVLTISSDGREGSIAIHQDALMYVAKPKASEVIEYTFQQKRYGWIQMIKGSVQVSSMSGSAVSLKVGDGAAIVDESTLKILADQDAEFLFFDLA